MAFNNKPAIKQIAQITVSFVFTENHQMIDIHD